VRSNKTQFADGKLTREAFEGELEGDADRQMVNEAERQDGALAVVVPALGASPAWRPGVIRGGVIDLGFTKYDWPSFPRAEPSIRSGSSSLWRGRCETASH
jgi:hypothetical protein